MMYNKNIYFYYIRIHNKNICCYYTRRYIITTNIFIIHESVYRVIRDDV